MNTFRTLTVGLCLGLSACGGIGAAAARWYDPDLVRQDGPVHITVVGARGADQTAIAAAIADSLRANGAQPGSLTPPGDASGYRIAVLFGPVAHDLAAAGDADNYATSCRTINSQAGASLVPTNIAVADGGTPILALMCYGNLYEALAYARLANGESVQAALPAVVGQLFPPPGAND